MSVLKKESTGIEKKFLELCSKVINDECGLSIYDLDYIAGSSTLRIFIMDKGSLTAQIEDCIKVDKALNPYIETQEWIPDALTLEVSSPGVYRKLNSLWHFETLKGEDISLVLNKRLGDIDASITANKLKKEKKIIAKLVETKESEIDLELEGQAVTLKFEDIKKAHAEPDIAKA